MVKEAWRTGAKSNVATRKSIITLILPIVIYFFTIGTISEPEYVTNLTKFFNDTYYTGTFYKKVTSKESKQRASKLLIVLIIFLFAGGLE